MSCRYVGHVDLFYLPVACASLAAGTCYTAKGMTGIVDEGSGCAAVMYHAIA